jgi:predicted PurR-regulated permease PerM
MNDLKEPHLRLKDLVIAEFIALGLFVAYYLRTTLLLLYVALIFAIVFTPAVKWVQQWRVYKWNPSRGAAILILLVIVLRAISLFLTLASGPIARDSNQFATQLPQTLSQLRNKLEALPFGSRLASAVNPESLQNALKSLAQTAVRVFRGVTGGLMALLTVPLVTAYLILDGPRTFGWSMSLVKEDERSRLATTLVRSRDRVQRWLVGQVILMFILGSLTALVLGLLHVRYFYLIAVFAGLANFVPILGPIATVILGASLAALDSWTKVLGVVAFYLVYQQVENAYLTPKIMRSTVDLPGIAVIVALALGSELGGILGAIVAVPTAALVGTIINEYGTHREENRASSL